MKSVMNFLVGFLLGSLLGAVFALLLAPTSGSELISRIQNEAERIRFEVSRAASERRAQLEQQLEVLRSPSTQPKN